MAEFEHTQECAGCGYPYAKDVNASWRNATGCEIEPVYLCGDCVDSACRIAHSTDSVTFIEAGYPVDCPIHGYGMCDAHTNGTGGVNACVSAIEAGMGTGYGVYPGTSHTPGTPYGDLPSDQIEHPDGTVSFRRGTYCDHGYPIGDTQHKCIDAMTRHGEVLALFTHELECASIDADDSFYSSGGYTLLEALYAPHAQEHPINLTRPHRYGDGTHWFTCPCNECVPARPGYAQYRTLYGNETRTRPPAYCAGRNWRSRRYPAR